MQVVIQPSAAMAKISVKGDDWSEATTSVTFERYDSLSDSYVPLSGGGNIQALGGAAVFLDVEMPVQNVNSMTVASYRAMNEHGEEVTASASSTEVEWGLWLKSKKAPELTTRLEWEQVGELISETQGAVYEVHGGPGVGQFGGVAPEQFTVYGWVDGRTAYNRLRRLLQTDRQIFMQTGEPKEFDDGWVQIRSVAFPNEEDRLIETGSGMRYVRIDCTRIDPPVGVAKGGLGDPYRLVYTGYEDYQALLDGTDSYADLLGVA